MLQNENPNTLPRDAQSFSPPAFVHIPAQTTALYMSLYWSSTQLSNGLFHRIPTPLTIDAPDCELPDRAHKMCLRFPLDRVNAHV